MENSLRILDIVEDTTVDGPGFRTAIYAAGCSHRCHGCHNPHSWAENGGERWTVDDLLDKIERAELSNVTFSGGDPLFQAEGFAELARRIKARNGKTIWCYTGYNFEQVVRTPSLAVILPHIDVLVDGRYIESLRDGSLQFTGSSNQRIIDVPSSLSSCSVVLWQPLFDLNRQSVQMTETRRRKRA